MKGFLNLVLVAMIIAALFHSTTGLKCYSKYDNRHLCGDTTDGEIVECPGPNPGCSISETFMSMGSLGSVKNCDRSCLDDLNSSNEGCFSHNIQGGIVNICNCGSDGCNENFDTAGKL